MKNIINKTKLFFSDEQGGEVAEWAVVVAILAGIAITSYQGTLGTAITGAIGKITTSINAA